MAAGTYTIDSAHSSAYFTVRHLMITNVKGSFPTVKGTIVYDPDNIGASSIEAEIDATSISTGEEQRDNHLRSADFFDVAQYPTITFKSTQVESDGGDFKVTGDLNMRGVTHSVVLNVDAPSEEAKDPWGHLRIGASAHTKIKRSDFGLNWNAPLETGGILVGDDIKIEIDISAIKA